MKLSITKSKNAEYFYISPSYINDAGKSASKIIRRPRTLNDLCAESDSDRDGVVAWVKEQVNPEAEKNKQEKRHWQVHFMT